MKKGITEMKNTQFEALIPTRLPEKVQRKRVNRVIREVLTEKQRQILLAYYFQQKTIPRIAAERGVNKSTVCRTLHRAEKRLKQYLQY